MVQCESVFLFPPLQLAMWTVYKKEIMAGEKEKKDFLKEYYEHNKAAHDGSEEGGGGGPEAGKKTPSNGPSREESMDWPIELGRIESIRLNSDFKA